MKVLHVLNDSVPLVGGYTSRSKCIVKYQKRVGIEPFVVTSVRQGLTGVRSEEIDGITYFRTNWSPGNLFRGASILGVLGEIFILYRNILRSIKAVQPQVIHSHSPILCAIPGLVAARKKKIPFVYEIRAFWEDAAVASGKFAEESMKYKSIGMLETLICRLADGVVTISQGMKNDLVRRGIPVEKLFVVPNGVDMEQHMPTTKDSSLVRDLGLNGKTVFGYIGLFYDFEGIEDLVRAFAELCAQEKNTKLLLVGGGEKETEIRGLSRDLCNDQVILTGKIGHELVQKYYSLIDILVYPRRSSRLTELTTPLKPLEAMAMGKPVIATSVGGLRQLIGDENGLFYPPGEERALVDCCLKLLRNHELRENLIKNGIHRALKERNWATVVKGYLKVYHVAYLSTFVGRR